MDNSRRRETRSGRLSSACEEGGDLHTVSVEPNVGILDWSSVCKVGQLLEVQQREPSLHLEVMGELSIRDHCLECPAAGRDFEHMGRFQLSEQRRCGKVCFFQTRGNIEPY